MDLLENRLHDVIPFLVSSWRLDIISNETRNIEFLCVAPSPPIQDEVRDPCYPSPCGPNSVCRNSNGVPSCSCLPTYIGVPPYCKPECTINSECISNKACIREKCIDPCPGSCGVYAKCNVINHTPICTCPDGYTGDPFTSCQPAPPPRKLHLALSNTISTIHSLKF